MVGVLRAEGDASNGDEMRDPESGIGFPVGVFPVKQPAKSTLKKHKTFLLGFT